MVVAVDVVQVTVTILIAYVVAVAILVDTVAQDLDGPVMAILIRIVAVNLGRFAIVVRVDRTEIGTIPVFVDSVARFVIRNRRPPPLFREGRFVDDLRVNFLAPVTVRGIGAVFLLNYFALDHHLGLVDVQCVGCQAVVVNASWRRNTSADGYAGADKQESDRN
jgi:hypothetical protein